jgi:uncharacterized delta-60 repeat protein
MLPQNNYAIMKTKMLVGIAVSCVLSLLSLAEGKDAPLVSCAGHLDDSFGANPLIHPGVSRDRRTFVAALKSGKVIVGGWGIWEGYGLARLKSDGSLDPDFQVSSLTGMTDLALTERHAILVAGADESSSGLSRYLQDGIRDPSFNPEFDGSVESIAALGSGEVYIGGSFSNVNGSARPGIARLNEDGSVDKRFKPTVTLPTNGGRIVKVVTDQNHRVLAVVRADAEFGGTYNFIWRFNPDGTLAPFRVPVRPGRITALAVQDNGRILIGFLESTYGSEGSLVRLRDDGTQDASFADPGLTGWVDYGIDVIKPLKDGRVLIGGSITEVGGQPRHALARLNADGSLDTTFNPAIDQFNSDDQIESVTSIDIEEGGSILIAGDFTRIDGVEQHGVARLFSRPDDCNGVVSFASEAYSASEEQGSVSLTLLRQGQKDHAVSVSYEILPADWLDTASIGEDITTLRGVVHFKKGQTSALLFLPIVNDALVEGSERFKVVLNATDGGAVLGEAKAATVTIFDDDSAGLPGQLVLSFAPPQDLFGHVQALGVQNGRLLVGGASGLFRLNADGSIDSSFHAPANHVAVNRLAVQPDGRIVVDGTTSTPGAGGIYELVRLNPDGSPDPTFTPVLPDGLVRAIKLLPDGKILLGGHFGLLSGISRSGIGRLLPDGQVDPTFAPLGIEKSDSRDGVYAIETQLDGKILIGGSFVRINGAIHPYAARLYPNGELDDAYRPILGGVAGAIAVQADGKALFGGTFFQVFNLPEGALFRYNTDGSFDSTFRGYVQTENSYEPTIQAILQQPDGKLLIAGSFQWAGPVSFSEEFAYRNGVARLHANGMVDDTFIPGSGAERGVNAIAQLPDGSVAIGGSFGSFNGYPRFGLALLYGDNNARPGFLEFSQLYQYTNESGGVLRSQVRRIWGTSGVVSVNYATSDAGAIAGADYQAQSGTLTFNDGEAGEKSIDVLLYDNSVLNATFRQIGMTLSSPTGGARLANRTSNTVTIVENELGAAFEFPNYRVSEGVGTFTIPVYGIGNESFSVNYSTVDGSAAAGTDYQPQSGILNFDGTGGRSITIQILPRPGTQGPRTLSIVLSNPSLPGHAGTPAVITIVDN